MDEEQNSIATTLGVGADFDVAREVLIGENMTHGNQGPKWWFAIFGSQSSNAGAARAVTMIVIFIIAASVILYLAKSSSPGRSLSVVEKADDKTGR